MPARKPNNKKVTAATVQSLHAGDEANLRVLKAREPMCRKPKSKLKKTHVVRARA
jgi:hypothetical protein